MAQVITNASITIGGVDLSSSIRKVTLSSSRAELDTTTFGSTGKRRVAGLADNKVSLDFNQDFSASSVEASIYTLLGTTTTIVIKPLGATVSATNPSYTFTALVTDWTPLDVQVGDLASATISGPIDGTITKAVA